MGGLGHLSFELHCSAGISYDLTVLTLSHYILALFMFPTSSIASRGALAQVDWTHRKSTDIRRQRTLQDWIFDVFLSRWQLEQLQLSMVGTGSQEPTTPGNRIATQFKNGFGKPSTIAELATVIPIIYVSAKHLQLL